MRNRLSACALLVIGMTAGCSNGTSGSFALTAASVDASYTCPADAADAPYSVNGVVDVRNGTASSVTIKSVTAVMTVAAVKGPWLEKVGDRYEAAGVTFSLNTVGAGSSTSANVVIPSTCTNGKTGDKSSYADYSIGFTITTSSGTYRIESGNRHRIVAG